MENPVRIPVYHTLLLLIINIVIIIKFTKSAPSREIHFRTTLIQSEAKCGEIIENRFSIELNEEPGTNKEIFINIEPTVSWARFYIGTSDGFNTYRWQQYIKRKDLTVSIKLKLLVPGCLPATTFAVSISGRYVGDVCDEVNCELSLNPNDKIQFTTSKPNIGYLNVSSFNVIPGKWSPIPIKLSITNKLLTPEVLTVKPKSLLNDALTFAAHRSSSISDNSVQFSWSRNLFSKINFMYVYGKSDLALGSELQIQFNLKCELCNFNQFFPNLKTPIKAIVSNSNKQRFIPLFIPSMKLFHKYCFNLKLNNIPQTKLNVLLSTECSAFHIEPKQLIYDKNINKMGNKDPKSQLFCITPKIAEQNCDLIFFLAGQGMVNYIKPNPITMYSIPYRENENEIDNLNDTINNNNIKKFTFPKVIQLTNRLLSDLYLFKFDKPSKFADITLIPIFRAQPDFFNFNPKQFEISHLLVENFVHFSIYPNVDCPLRTKDINMSAYWIIEWDIIQKTTINTENTETDTAADSSGSDTNENNAKITTESPIKTKTIISKSLKEYYKPHPIYIKVIENLKETEPQMDWCDDTLKESIDCSNPPMNGITCFPDICVLDPDNNSICKPLYIYGDIWEYGFKEYAIGGTILLLIIYIVARQIGCIGNPQLPTIDEEKEIEEKAMFNTAENLREAQVAIENLLWQIYRYEQKLDIGARYERDVFRNEKYWDD